MELRKLRYIVVPGYMISATDNDVHYISFGALTRLYGVPRDRCVLCSKTHPAGTVGFVTLEPRYNGDYDVESAIKRSEIKNGT